MKTFFLSTLLTIFTLSCSQEKDRKPTVQETVTSPNNISIQLKNVPTISDTLKIEGNKSIIVKEPFISYKTKNNFIKNIVNVEKEAESFDFEVDEDEIYLKLRYNFNKFKTFVFSRGDSIIISFKDGAPNLNLTNRKSKKHDYSVSDFLQRYKRPLDFRDFLKKYKRIRTPEEEEEYKEEIQATFIKAISGIDSLRNINQLSANIYDYHKKSIYYMQERKDVDTENIIKGNTDLHIDTYTGLLLKYVTGNIKKRIVKTSNGSVINSVECFDFVHSNKSMFENKSKDFLLWHFIKEIAKDFSSEEFQSRFEIFTKEVSDSRLVNEIKDDYLVDYSLLSKTTDNVILIDNGKKKINLKDFLIKNKGKVIFIDFWASWCAPCRKVMPESKKLIIDYKNKDVVFLFISIDKSHKNWKKAQEDENIMFYEHNTLAINYPNAKFYKDLNLKSIPRYLIFNKKGELVHKNAPSPDSKELQSLLNKYIDE
ncbi:TlpA family protein disulfide reductase [Aurantibacter sp.]|uniref:TlpA family protein disulfide reductase n=1 Tax=Aurantibacter sp. TaxID=2807103 RepID=UPI0035C875A1